MQQLGWTELKEVWGEAVLKAGTPWDPTELLGNVVFWGGFPENPPKLVQVIRILLLLLCINRKDASLSINGMCWEKGPVCAGAKLGADFAGSCGISSQKMNPEANISG